MIDLKKEFNYFKIITVLLITIFWADASLFSYQFSKDVLRLFSSFQSPQKERLRAAVERSASNHILSSSDMDRRVFLGITTVGLTIEPYIRGEEGIDEVSEEGIAYRVIELLEMFKRRIEIGLSFNPMVLTDKSFWEKTLPDLSSKDAGRAFNVYKKYLKENKNKNKTNLDLLNDIINSLRDGHQLMVNKRSKGLNKVFGVLLSIIGKDESRDGVEILIAEPAIALTRNPFNAAISYDRILFVATNANLFIDEVIVPLVKGREVTRWRIRGLAASDRRVHKIFSRVVEMNFISRTREDCFNILKGITLRHDMKHLRPFSFNRPVFQKELLKAWPLTTGMPGKMQSELWRTDSDIVNSIAGEMDSYLDELEGDYPDISFMRMLEILEKDLNLYNGVGFTDYPTYAALSIIFAELCGQELFKFLHPDAIDKNKAADIIRSFIISNLGNTDSNKYNYALMAQRIRVKYGLSISAAKLHMPNFKRTQL